MSIRWKLIRKICEDITKKPVEINLSTALHNLLAFMYAENEKISIMVSAKCKRESEVVVAVAHEITHFQMGSDIHNRDFDKKLKEILKVFSERMKLSEKTLYDSIERLEEF
jgi:predicted polyphosphate/ATP-dependent NAD kinase